MYPKIKLTSPKSNPDEKGIREYFDAKRRVEPTRRELERISKLTSNETR